MTYSFNDALRTLVHKYSTAVENVRQRVLPTPGKRKRVEEECGVSLDENQPPKQRILETQVKKPLMIDFERLMGPGQPLGDPDKRVVTVEQQLASNFTLCSKHRAGC